MRAVPLQWGANRYAGLVYDLQLTKSGVNYHVYKAARALGYEADAVNNEAKTKARQEALKRGNLTAEDVDDGIAATPKSYFATLDESLQSARDVLEELAVYCEEQYRDDGPSWRKLRDSLEEVHNLVNSLLSDKRAIEPDPIPVAEAPPAAEYVPEPVAAAPVVPIAPVTVAVPIAAPVATAVTAAPVAMAAAGTPQSWDDAVSRVEACAAYMHTQRQGSSVPYLLFTSIRWGELRKHGAKPPLDVMVAPPSELRSGLKLANAEKAWADLLSRAMAALRDPSARTWLDLHRYLWTAAKENGYGAFATMIVTAVQGILSEYPEMPQWTFLDDTAVANADTLKWLSESVQTGAPKPASSVETAAVASQPAPVQVKIPVHREDSDEPEDAFITAATLAASGQLGAATALLARDAAQQPSGRMRYSRRMQIAELCLAGGNSGIATPILQELIEEMERRNLESWESGDLITKPIALLLRSANGSMDAAHRQVLFSRLCRIDPSAALDIVIEGGAFGTQH